MFHIFQPCANDVELVEQCSVIVVDNIWNERIQLTQIFADKANK